jgi:hypothetical protein
VAYSGDGGGIPAHLELESYSKRADEHHHDEVKLAVKKMALEAHWSALAMVEQHTAVLWTVVEKMTVTGLFRWS